jgi:2'-5' RNA ligase
MRLFVAVDLDEPARSAVVREQARLRALVPTRSLRWVRPEHLHITLAFLGEVDDARLGAIVGIFGPAIQQAPFALRLGGLGVFPPRGAPRTLWIGSNGPQLNDLRSEIARRIERVGLRLDTRSFSSHLTIGRWKSSTSGDRSSFLSIQLPEPLAHVKVDHATLYQSRLSSAGPIYTECARVNVTGT